VLPLLTAALALVGVAMPASAQSAYQVTGKSELIIQNNRSVPVTIYLESGPFERQLGRVEAMRSASFSVPEHLLREGETIDLLIEPRGQLALKAKAFVSDDVTQLGLVVPATPNQERRMDAALVAWDMRNPPVVTVQDEFELD
jgi:hypothetical protein